VRRCLCGRIHGYHGARDLGDPLRDGIADTFAERDAAAHGNAHRHDVANPDSDQQPHIQPSHDKCLGADELPLRPGEGIPD
jgi:hypothetical protein